jgi:NAD(P)H-nitrite reductase large subunit
MNEGGTAPNFLCRCEEVDAGAIREAIADGARSINDIKRRTRAGMGVCQGVYCVRPMADLLSDLTGEPLSEIVPMTARPPVRPVPLGLLAALED